jgi:PAS domain S-box-containing protein
MADKQQHSVEKLRATAHEAELERAKADALFASIGDGAVVTDEHGRISRVNQVALDILGYTEKELIGKWYPKTIIAEDVDGNTIPIMSRPISQSFMTGKPASDRLLYRRKDGSKIPVAITYSPVLLNGRPTGALGIFRDISKEYEVDRMKSEFISIASHQLRTPLTAIKLDSYMLQEGYMGELTPLQHQQVDMIIYSIRRMEELISTLLNITRIEAGRIAITPKPTHLLKLIKAIVKELDGMAQDKNISVDVKAPNGMPPVVTDALLVKETVANLLSNALKYSPENTSVTITVWEKDGEVIFSISDNGYGIPASEHDRIFTKFYRGSNIKQKEAIGTGLGLYMIKGVVDALDGSIWFESRENTGTTFYVSLPKGGPSERQGSTTIEPTVVKLS